MSKSSLTKIVLPVPDIENLATQSADKLSIRSRFENAVKNAPKDSIRVKDVEAKTLLFNESLPSYDPLDGIRDMHRVITNALAVINKPDDILNILSELRSLLEELNNPLSILDKLEINKKGVIALLDHLEAAKLDPQVQKSKAASSLAKMLFNLIQSSNLGDDGDRVLDRIGKIALSNKASRQAKSKNVKEREWVQQEWKNRTDKGQSKASFARQYTHLVAKKFGSKIKITEDTIKRVWLAKL